MSDLERVCQLVDKQAPKYDRKIRLSERLLFRGGREWVCSRAHGRTLEIAVGTGRNLRYYPEGVELVGIDLSTAMLGIAQRYAADTRPDADLRVGNAESLDFPDASFDTGVCTLGLCTIPDDRAAVAEARRVLRPGGRFLLLEHVRSPIRRVRFIQSLLEPLTVRLSADHLMREPVDHLRDEGFVIDEQERSKRGIVERVAAHAPEGSP